MNPTSSPKFILAIILILCLSLTLTGCRSRGSVSIPTPIPPTDTPIPPSATPGASQTPTPTYTSAPIPTDTSTPIPPTETLDPSRGGIQGRLYWAASNEPMANATVVLFGDNISFGDMEVTTDSDGSYYFLQVPPGIYKLRIITDIDTSACAVVSSPCHDCYALITCSLPTTLLGDLNTTPRALFIPEGWVWSGFELWEINVSAGQIVTENLEVECGE